MDQAERPVRPLTGPLVVRSRRFSFLRRNLVARDKFGRHSNVV
jgi:hypothetical protein